MPETIVIGMEIPMQGKLYTVISKYDREVVINGVVYPNENGELFVMKSCDGAKLIGPLQDNKS